MPQQTKRQPAKKPPNISRGQKNTPTLECTARTMKLAKVCLVLTQKYQIAVVA
jgi:hypothetical protein